MPEPIAPETNLKDYLDVLRRRRWVIISFFLVCTTTVTLGTFLMTPLYRSSTKILIEGENSNVLSAEDSGSSVTSFDVFENYLETQMALIESDSIAGKVFDELKLGKSDRYKRREGWKKILRKRFHDDIYLKRLPGTRMILLSVENPDRDMAAQIANRLSEVYVDVNMSRRALDYIRNQRMAALNAEFLQLQSRYDSLSNQFGPKHPEMVILREQIQMMALRVEHERDALHEKTLVQEAEPSSDEERMKLEQTLLRIQEKSVLSSSKIKNIGIVDRAHPSKEPSKPKRPLNIALGLVLGLFGGILAAFVAEYMDDTIKTDEELKRKIPGIAFLGSLMAERKTKADVNDPTLMDRLVHVKPDSASAEAYRLLRTRFLWSLPKDVPAKDFAVVSSIPSEGKSTITSNLAIALSQIKKKVLLVDTDIRRGRVHKSFNRTDDKGLCTFLSDEASLEEVIQKTEIENLWLVAAGKSVIDSSQLFSSPQMSDFIRRTREQFDFILYDTPPITVISDAPILIGQLGGCLLTSRSGVTSTRLLQKTLTMIRESGAHLVGIVLNDLESSENTAYHNYYHAYHRK